MKIHIRYLSAIALLTVCLLWGYRHHTAEIESYRLEVIRQMEHAADLTASLHSSRDYAASLRQLTTANQRNCAGAMDDLLRIPALALPPVPDTSNDAPPVKPVTTGSAPVNTAKAAAKDSRHDAAYTYFLNTF